MVICVFIIILHQARASGWWCSVQCVLCGPPFERERYYSALSKWEWVCGNGMCAHTPASVVLDSGEKESFFFFHYTQAYAIMKAILIGFNACCGARSCYLMAVTKEYKSVIMKVRLVLRLCTHRSFPLPFVCCTERKNGQSWSAHTLNT